MHERVDVCFRAKRCTHRELMLQGMAREARWRWLAGGLRCWYSYIVAACYWSAEIESTRTDEIIRAPERSRSCGERGGFVWKRVFVWFMSE